MIVLEQLAGMPIQKDEQTLKKNPPHIVVGTPGRMLALARSKALVLKNVKHFILDECDKMLEALGQYSCIVPVFLLPFYFSNEDSHQLSQLYLVSL